MPRRWVNIGLASPGAAPKNPQRARLSPTVNRGRGHGREKRGERKRGGLELPKLTRAEPRAEPAPPGVGGCSGWGPLPCFPPHPLFSLFLLARVVFPPFAFSSFVLLSFPLASSFSKFSFSSFLFPLPFHFPVSFPPLLIFLPISRFAIFEFLLSSFIFVIFLPPFPSYFF